MLWSREETWLPEACTKILWISLWCNGQTHSSEQHKMTDSVVVEYTERIFSHGHGITDTATVNESMAGS